MAHVSPPACPRWERGGGHCNSFSLLNSFMTAMKIGMKDGFWQNWHATRIISAFHWDSKKIQLRDMCDITQQWKVSFGGIATAAAHWFLRIQPYKLAWCWTTSVLMCSRKEIRFSFDFKEKPAAGNMKNSTFSSASGGGGGGLGVRV